MRRLRAFVLIFAASAACGPRAPATAAAVQKPDPLSARIHARLARAPGTVAVVLLDLYNGDGIRIHDSVRMHAASTMKVPVMLELYRQAAANRLSLADSIRITNAFTSIADASAYSLSPEADSDTAIYGMLGDKATIRELNRRMITRSSNLATNLLIRVAGAERVMKTMRAIGAGGMHVLRGVEDIPAYRRGMNNTTTAAAFARVLEFMARCARSELSERRPPRVASLRAEDCRDMIEVLADQHFNTMIPAGVPEGVRVAHKTGWITEIHHDGGIIYPDGRPPYVLVVMTHGIQDPERSADVVADISRLVWQQDTSSGPDNEGLVLIRTVSRLLWNYFEPDSTWQPVAGPLEH